MTPFVLPFSTCLTWSRYADKSLSHVTPPPPPLLSLHSSACRTCWYVYDLQASVVESAVQTAAKGDEQCAALLHTTLAPQIATVRPQLLELVDTFLEQLM